MSQSQFSIDIRKGANRVVLWPILVMVNGEVTQVDLDGALAVAEIRAGADAPLLLRLESAGTAPALSFDGHHLRMDFTPAHTEGAKWSTGLMDVLITLRNGTVMRTPVAEVVLHHGITRA